MREPQAMTPVEPCAHLLTINGVCDRCGKCNHTVIVNGVCCHCHLDTWNAAQKQLLGESPKKDA